MCGSRGTGDPDPPLQYHKNIGFLSNIDPDPLKIAKLPSQHSMVGHYRHASEMPLEWRFDGVPIMSHFFSGILILSPSHQVKKRKKKKKKKKKRWTPLTKLSGSERV